MTTFYLDTSVAITESFLKSPFAEAFMKACAILQHAVVIPEIVIDELKGNFPKKIHEKYLSVVKTSTDLGKLIDIDVPDISIEDATAEYGEWIESLIDSSTIIVAPYPDISPKELIERSYELQKPFKESGEGHKDYIVWKTVLAGINGDKWAPPFVFLTNNIKDFCELDTTGSNKLHSGLSAQVIDDARKPIIYTSIKAAFENELSPYLEGLALGDIPDLEGDIDEMVGEYLLQDIPNKTLYGLDGIPFNDEITISAIGAHSVDSVTLKKAGEEVIITASGTVEIEADGFMDKFTFYNIDDSKSDVFVVDGNWNDHVMLVSSTIDTPYEATIFYSTTHQSVTGREISLTAEIEDEWPYK